MRRILRDAAMAALIVLFYILQMAFGEKLALWGVKPELLPFAAAAAGVVAGKTTGAWIGFLGGVLCDLSTPWGIGPRAAVFFLTGAVVGELTRRTLRRSFLTAFLFGLAAAALSQLADAMTHAALGIPYEDLFRSAGYGTLYACLLFPLSWLPLRGIARLFRVPGESIDTVQPVRIDEMHHAARRWKGDGI